MKICVVTGTRAEYGLLYWILKELQSRPEVELQIVATGAHLSEDHGLTYREIEKDGFRIAEKVPILQQGDTWADITGAMARGVAGFTAAFSKLKPDVLVLLGDRYEMLAAAQVGLVAKIPMAHLFAGDVTEGAFDEAIRHSITKMAHLHFVTSEDSARRVRQLGENPDFIFNFGSPGLDHLLRTTLLTQAQLETQLGCPLRAKNFLVTYHPETLNGDETGDGIEELLKALSAQSKDTLLLFTAANADPGGQAINKKIEQFVSGHENGIKVDSLGQIRYLSCLQYFDLVIGNSSSGLYEAPSFQLPTINIGDRQKGRLRAASVIDCEASEQKISAAIAAGLKLDCSKVINPFGDGHSSVKIVKQLLSLKQPLSLLNKKFFDLEIL